MTTTDKPGDAPATAAPRAASQKSQPAAPTLIEWPLTAEDEAIRCATAVGWEPKPGDEIWFTFVRIQITASTITDEDTGRVRTVRYPLCTVLLDATPLDGNLINIHAFHAVLAAALAAQRPLRGDRGYIKRLADAKGKGDRKDTYMYAVAVTKPSDAAPVDIWDMWAQSGKG